MSDRARGATVVVTPFHEARDHLLENSQSVRMCDDLDFGRRHLGLTQGLLPALGRLRDLAHCHLQHLRTTLRVAIVASHISLSLECLCFVSMSC